MGADPKGLAAMPSLGKATADMLVEAGIETPAQLLDLGAEEAYRRLRFAFGKRAKATYLYALDIAVRGGRWDDLSAGRMAKLRKRAEAIQREVNATVR